MEKEDARRQTREVLHERRKQVIRMHRKGMPVMQIVAYSGLSWYAVNLAIKRYAVAGIA
ncbi:MAG: IS630 family transposase, partial [Nitrosospira sp.]